MRLIVCASPPITAEEVEQLVLGEEVDIEESTGNGDDQILSSSVIDVTFISEYITVTLLLVLYVLHIQNIKLLSERGKHKNLSTN